MRLDIDAVYKKFKSSPTSYDEEFHCKLLLKVMTNRSQGTMSAYCVEAEIGESTFWGWVKGHELFSQIYSFCKMWAREAWEQEGRELRDRALPIGMIDHGFEYWKLIGWSRFGISKNSRIKLDLNPNDTPDKHYSQLLLQASNGDFTAGEIKQLMEAVNVGLNTHQVHKLQDEINELKSDLAIMATNTNVQNSFTDKGIA